MFTRRTLFAALAVSMTLSGPAAFARGGDPKPGGKVEGILSAVTAAPASVTINGVTLNVLPGTKIEINDLHATLAALTVGAPAEAEYDPATRNATKVEQTDDAVVEPEDATVSGKVLNADPASGRVAFDTNGDGAADLTFTTDAQTEVEIGSAHLAPSQLALLNGLPALVEYFTDTLRAKEIKATPTAPASLTGKVKSVDARAGRITLQTTKGVRTLAVPVGADIRTGRRVISLASVAPGANAATRIIRNGSGVDVLLKMTVSGVRAGAASVQRRGRGADDGPGHIRHGRGQDDDGVHHHRGRGRDH